VASRSVTVLTDDLDGTELKDGQGQTVTFSVGSTQYEIDLSDQNLERFYDALKPYTDVARKVGRRSGSRAAPAKSAAGRTFVADVDPKAVRAWADGAGVEVSSRGRIPAEVVEQYRAAGN
jgi:hypothetical protein